MHILSSWCRGLGIRIRRVGDNINRKGGEERDRMEFEKVEDIYSMSVRNYNVHGRELVGDIEQGGGGGKFHPSNSAEILQSTK